MSGAESAAGGPPEGGFPRTVKSYVLRAGRMTPAQNRFYEEYFPRYGAPFCAEADAAGSGGGNTPGFQELFGNGNPVVAEIGFGAGTATARLAEQNPHINYLGIEVYRPGIGRLLREIENRGIRNIRIVEYDAVEVFRRLIPDRSLAGIHVFFPDPWPKKRHHKRRLVTRPFTCVLARKLRPAGNGEKAAYLYLVTDWEAYAFEALAELSATPGLFNPHADNGTGFAPRQEWRPETEFERKGLKKNHLVREIYVEAAGPRGSASGTPAAGNGHYGENGKQQH